MKTLFAALLILAGIPAVGLAQTTPDHSQAGGAGGHPPMSGGHPPMSGGHPPMSGGHPPMSGGHPPMSGGHPPTAGGHSPMMGGAVASPSNYRMPSDMIAPQAASKAGGQLVPLGQPAAVTPPARPPLPNSGTVVSSTDAGGYSYIEVSGPEGNTWLAAPTVKVKTGDKIRFENGATMRNFSSRALGRTFPAISFVGQVVLDTN